MRQPTATTVSFHGDKVRLSKKIDGQTQGGDGTVPRLAAQPLEGWDCEVTEVAEQHGQLQATTSLLDLVDGVRELPRVPLTALSNSTPWRLVLLEASYPAIDPCPGAGRWGRYGL